MELPDQIKAIQKKILAGEDVSRDELAEVLKAARIKWTADQATSKTTRSRTAAAPVDGQNLLDQLL